MSATAFILIMAAVVSVGVLVTVTSDMTFTRRDKRTDHRNEGAFGSGYDNTPPD
ncbi:hypothetical protein BH09ACT12_BH09ACT12_11480 [soil metagenome]